MALRKIPYIGLSIRDADSDRVHSVVDVQGDGTRGTPIYVRITCQPAYHHLDEYDEDDAKKPVSCLFCIAGGIDGPA